MMIMMMTEQISQLYHLLTQKRKNRLIGAEDAATDSAKHLFQQPNTKTKTQTHRHTGQSVYTNVYKKRIYSKAAPSRLHTHKPKMTMMMTKQTAHPRHL